MRLLIDQFSGLWILSLLLAPAFARGDSLPLTGNRLPFLRATNARLVDPSDSPVILKGCNLGNWLMLEPWMFGGCLPARDQADIFTTLANRFGADRRDHLLDLHRMSYITPRDFDLIKSFGFNVVRLPFHYSLVQEDAPPYNIKPNAFVYLDHALEMAEAAGVYVILDLHGAPGGQSKDMPTGEVGQNHLWTSDVFQKRTFAIWHAVAQRYHDRAVVAGYDLLNEPYGDFKQDLKPDLVKLMSSLYTTVREADDRHVMFFSGPIQKGIAFYGNPREKGWHDVGFTEHYYPGLFGSKPVVESHANLFAQTFPERKKYLDQIGSPYYIGEFNVVLSAAGGNRMMREYFDRIGANGWTCTMWSYKLLQAGGHGDDRDVWYAATNTAPLPKLDLQTSSYEEFEKFFASLATIPLSVNEPLRQAITMANPPPLPLPESPAVPMTIPTVMLETPAGWTATDIGGAERGGASLDNKGVMTIYAAGSDIFNTSDSFRFLSKPAKQPSDFSARLISMLDTDTYAKAGVMARWGNEPDAPFAMVNAFPDGSVAFLSRATSGAAAVEKKTQAASATNLELRIKIDNGRASGFFREPAGEWKEIASGSVPATPAFDQGYAACAHRDSGFTVARFAPVAGADGKSAESSIGLPDRWQTAGLWNHTLDGTAVIYTTETAGRLWQDVPAIPRHVYRCSAVITDDSPSAKQPVGKDARKEPKRTELRLENTIDDHQVVLNSTPVAMTTRFRVQGTSMTDHIRVVILTPGDRKITVREVSLVDLTGDADASAAR